MLAAAEVASEIASGLTQGVRYDDPYPLTYFRPFSDATYAAMLAQMPGPEAYSYHVRHPDTDRGDGTVTRSYLALHEQGLAGLAERQRSFWLAAGKAFQSPEVLSVFMQHMAPELERRFERPIDQIACHPAPRLFRDVDGYRIAPHPDSKKRLLTIMLYLPDDDSQRECGTSIYRVREDRSFEIVRTLPFLPNTGFCFVPCANSFHGAEDFRLPKVRQSLALHCFTVPSTT